ncbi:MAG: HEAT repeat domain-containing protein [Candidatus Brocadia sp.]|nr:HEAT repeat domain-containing protein [Candidatus Brocadia sp.]
MELWYEIYHDLFSEPIKEWNEAFKSKQRKKQAIIISIFTLLTCGLLYAGFDIITNQYCQEFRLSEKFGISDTIEIHRGASGLGRLDTLKLHVYRIESDFNRNQVEPDKMFAIMPFYKNKLCGGIIDYLTRLDRLKAYWEDGQVNSAMKLAKEAIRNDNEIVTMLGTFRSTEAIKVLENSLDDSRVTLREKIVSALVGMPSPLAAKKRTELMADEDTLIQRSAIAAAKYSLHPTDFREILDLFLTSNDIKVRKTAADALGWLREPRAVRHLVAVLKNNKDSELRKTTTDALGRLNCSESVQPLLDLLQNTNQRMEDVRLLAATALGQMDVPSAAVPLIDILKDPNVKDNMRRVTISALEQVKDARAYEVLVKILQNKTYNEYMRANVIDALGQLNDKCIVDTLIECFIDDSSNHVRSYASESLGQLGDARAVASLCEYLNNPPDPDSSDVLLRWYVLGALGRLGDPQAVDSLMKTLFQDQDAIDFLRWRAAEALERLGDTQAVPPLLDQLKKLPDSAENTSERIKITLALGRLGQAEAVKPLINNLNNSIPIVRWTAAYALKKLGDVRAVKPLLTRLTDDSDPLVRRSAAKALGLLSDSRAINPLKTHLDDSCDFVRWSVMDALVKLNVPAGNPLAEKLKPRFEYMRQITPQMSWSMTNPVIMEPAIRVIREERDKREIHMQAETIKLPELEKLTNSAQVTDRKNAASILGKAIDKRPDELTQQGADLLIKLLDDSNLGVKSEAAKSCGKARLDEATDKLVSLLRHSNLRIQREAAEALAEITEKPPINEPEKLRAGIEPLLKLTETAVPVRLALLMVLKNIGSKNAIEAIVEAVKIDETSHDNLGLRAYNLLGDMGGEFLKKMETKNSILDHLNQRLKKLEEQHAQWRNIRESKQSDNSTQQNLADWPTQHKPWAFVLAYNIARIDPGVSGLKLLSHDIADARKGAWTGLGKVGDVNLIKDLDEKRSMTKKQPLFCHAAYRAIDYILIRLEIDGDENTLENLKTLQVKDNQGVGARVAWTIDAMEWALEQRRQKGGDVDGQQPTHSSNTNP